ncbi:MAG: ATP synthase subunit I [Lachnospiraceae bacterium]|nr:ATP synthase subunit I [Lachnospiraceae bacterium]
MSDEIRQQVFEMSVGIVLHNLILLLGSLIWFRELSVLLGILIGAAGAFALLYSMAWSTELCAGSGDENYARKKMTVHAVLRGLTVFAAVIILWRFTNINPLAVVLGVLGLKSGAYLYPTVHRHWNHKER